MLLAHRPLARFLSPLLPMHCHLAGAAITVGAGTAATKAFP